MGAKATAASHAALFCLFVDLFAMKFTGRCDCIVQQEALSATQLQLDHE